jgi:hypothetical protein
MPCKGVIFFGSDISLFCKHVFEKNLEKMFFSKKMLPLQNGN